VIEMVELVAVYPDTDENYNHNDERIYFLFTHDGVEYRGSITYEELFEAIKDKLKRRDKNGGTGGS